MTPFAKLRHLLQQPKFASTKSIQILDRIQLARFNELLLSTKTSTNTKELTARSCFQWLFHSDCDVLNCNSTITSGKDGNPAIVPNHRRMWVGGKIAFLQPFYSNDIVEKQTKITNVQEKQTKSQGNVIFVERESKLYGQDGKENMPGMIETTTHAYLESTHYMPPPASALIAIPSSTHTPFNTVIKDIDSSLLFKYSALTYNSHKIHYDYNYATASEGYPNLVVHGPLIASWMLDWYQTEILQDDKYSGYEFEYRGKSPMFLGSDLYLTAEYEDKNQSQIIMNAKNNQGRTVMTAKVNKLQGTVN